jgi:hypothetical protein
LISLNFGYGKSFIFSSPGLFFSCSTVRLADIPGKYKAASKDSRTKIVFLENGRFSFEQQNLDVTSSCEGNWKMSSETN